MNQIRMGFIGVGGIGGSHLRIASASADLMQPVAVCDNNPGIANQRASEHGVDAHTDYRELCSRDDIDAVVMALPHYLYGQVVCHALESGLHVFKEKPMAHSLSDAQRMVHAADSTGKQLMVAAQSKFSAAFIKGKEIVDSGVLGEVYLTRAAIIYRWGGAVNDQWNWRGSQEQSGGVAILDAGWHILDMVHWYRGLPSAVYASVGQMKGIPDSSYDVDDKAALTLDYPDGGIGSIVSCYIALPGERRVTLHGTNGSLDVNGEHVSLHLGGEAQEVELPAQAHDPMTLQLRHFAEQIIAGEESSLANHHRAYEVMQVVDAAYRSSRQQTRVRL